MDELNVGEAKLQAVLLSEFDHVLAKETSYELHQTKRQESADMVQYLGHVEANHLPSSSDLLACEKAIEPTPAPQIDNIIALSYLLR